ncbi:hypothetical protein [Arthrobacter sp. HLT1-21]
MSTIKQKSEQESEQKQGNKTALVVAGFVLLHVLCCGLPLLIAAGALGATGSLLGNPWLITAAVVLALGVLVWVFRRRASGKTDDGDCCVPPGTPGRDQIQNQTGQGPRGR